MESSYLHIKSANDIDFKNILDDYRHNFVGHILRIETNYNLLSQIDILFSENDLPHLMGWQKVRSKNKNANKIIMDVDNKRFTVKEAKKNIYWKNIKSRMINYNFLHEIFIEKNKSIMVLTSDMKPNRLKLDVKTIIENQ